MKSTWKYYNWDQLLRMWEIHWTTNVSWDYCQLGIPLNSSAAICYDAWSASAVLEAARSKQHAAAAKQDI